MRRRFHGEVGDAISCKPVQRLMQADGIRCRQRAIFRALIRDDAQRAKTRRAMAAGGDNLAREIRDRALAGRSCHGHDRFRHAGEETLRQQGEEAARILDREEEQAVRRPCGRFASEMMTDAPRAAASAA